MSSTHSAWNKQYVFTGDWRMVNVAYSRDAGTMYLYWPWTAADLRERDVMEGILNPLEAGGAEFVELDPATSSYYSRNQETYGHKDSIEMGCCPGRLAWRRYAI